MKKIRILIMALLLTSSTASIAAQKCFDVIPASAPASRFQLHGVDGTVTDRKSTLMWQRCLLGQRWNVQKSSCEGAPETYNYQDAIVFAAENNFAGHRWRLPNIKELSSIIEFQCDNPMLNINIFKFGNDYPQAKIMSSTLVNNYRIHKIYFHFSGVTFDESILTALNVLLVRDVD